MRATFYASYPYETYLHADFAMKSREFIGPAGINQTKNVAFVSIKAQCPVSKVAGTQFVPTLTRSSLDVVSLHGMIFVHTGRRVMLKEGRSFKFF